MKTIIKPRQGGKTTDLIKISSETKYPIIVRNQMEVNRVKQMAGELGLEIPDPLYIRDAMNTRMLYTSKVLVDDAEFVLDFILHEVCGCSVDTLTMVQRNEKGHEIDTHGDDINVKYHLGD